MEMDKIIEMLLSKIKEGTIKLKESIEGKDDLQISAMIKESLGIEDEVKEAVSAKILEQIKSLPTIEAIKGVEFVNITEFRHQLSNIAVEPTGKIELRASEIATVPDAPEYAGSIKVVFEGEL